MKTTKAVLCLLSLFVLGGQAGAAKYRVERSYPQGGPKLGQETIIQFSLYRMGEPNPLKSGDLDIEHEKLIHMMLIDSGFREYRHEHPQEVTPGVWQVPVTLKTAGDYRFYLQFLPDG